MKTLMDYSDPHQILKPFIVRFDILCRVFDSSQEERRDSFLIHMEFDFICHSLRSNTSLT